MVRRLLGTANAGVYTADGPAGIYVGESTDCPRRNRQLTLLGIPWRIVRSMPESTRSERLTAETAVADALAAQRHVIVSQNTTAALAPKFEKMRAARVHLKWSPTAPGHARMSALHKGKKLSAETREKMRAAKLGVQKSSAHVEAMRAARLGRPHPQKRH